MKTGCWRLAGVLSHPQSVPLSEQIISFSPRATSEGKARKDKGAAEAGTRLDGPGVQILIRRLELIALVSVLGCDADAFQAHCCASSLLHGIASSMSLNPCSSVPCTACEGCCGADVRPFFLQSKLTGCS